MRTTIVSCIMLAVVALAIGLFNYGSGLIEEYINRSCTIAEYSNVAVRKSADVFGLSKKVMDVYRSLTPEQRESENYLDYYSDFDTSTTSGGDYGKLFHLLRSFTIDVDDVYLGMYDRDSNALVYIVDPDANEETRLKLGEWEYVEERETQLFLDWDGEERLYDISSPDKYGWMCTAGYPLRDENGEICAFILVDVMLDSILKSMIGYAWKVGLALLVATVLIAVFVAQVIKLMVADPINEIARAAESYVEDKKDGVEREHFTGLGADSGYEIVNLAGVMAGMERELAQHEERITRITAQEERIKTELGMARQIQESMLPNEFPAYPDRSEFDIYATMEPAKEVGGDYYDFFLIDDDHLCMVIADVSGKGIPAALFMMIIKTIVQSCAMLGHGPADILRKTNEGICSNNRLQMFVSVWVGILEISTGKITAANAGHEYPALTKNGEFFLMKDHHDLVIGAMEDRDYKEYELMLAPGDKLFVYTDGLPEATDSGEKMFGTDRMIAALNKNPDASPELILKDVRRAVDEFVKDAEQFDDLTMLCMEYDGKDTE